MAIQSAVFTFSLPEDTNSDQIRVYSSATQNGTYDLVVTDDYSYGITELEWDELNDVLWYKIQFNNSTDGESGPISEAVYGGTFNAAAPFLAVSSSSDGANYATSQELYDYSGLTTADVNQSKVSRALRQARAKIDFRMAEAGFDRFQVFDTPTQRRKYNASLRLVKDAEINIALGVVYTNLSDDLIIANMRAGAGSSAGSVSIGSTSVQGDSLAERTENILYLATLAARYAAEGESILSSLDTNSVRLVGVDYQVRSPRFKFPFNGWM